jgi:hypothetical protein
MQSERGARSPHNRPIAIATCALPRAPVASTRTFGLE